MHDHRPARANRTTDTKAMPEKTPSIGIHTSSVFAQLQKSMGNRAMVQLLRNHAESSRPIQRIEDSEIEPLVQWWDAWLIRAIEYRYIAETEKAEWLEKGNQLIQANKKLTKKEIQIALDRMLRSKVPMEEGDHIPIEFRVPEERLAKGKLVESLQREDFIPKLETEARSVFESMAHTLHHKISDAVLRALAGRLNEALAAQNPEAVMFYEVLTQQARYGASLKDKATHNSKPLASVPTARELYKHLTNAPVNLEPGPRAGLLRDTDNDAGSTFDGNTVPTEEDDGSDTEQTFAPGLSIRADPVPWNPRNRRLSIRSGHLYKIFIIAEKMYANNRYTPTSEEWVEMTRELSLAVAEHNRLLKAEHAASVGLTAPRMEQWTEHGGKFLRKHTEEGLLLAHDHKREIGNGDALSEKEKLELKKQQEAENARLKKRREEERLREAEEEAAALEIWAANEKNMAKVLKSLLRNYADQVNSLNKALLVVIAGGSGQVDKKMRDSKWKAKQKETEKSRKDWAILLKQKSEEIWKSEKKPGLQELRDEKAKQKSAVESGSVEAPVISVSADNHNYVFNRIFEEYRQQYPLLVPENGDLPEGVVHPQVQDEVLPQEQLARASEVRSEHLEELSVNNEGLSGWLEGEGIQVAPNSGSGMNCLIISLLQHATENYGSEHDEEARDLRQRLQVRFPTIGEHQMLHSDDEAVTWLVEQINTTHEVNLNPVFVRANENGLPFILPSNFVDGTRVVIWDRGGHYEALYQSGD